MHNLVLCIICLILNPEMRDILSLIKRVKEGDKVAFDELYKPLIPQHKFL